MNILDSLKFDLYDGTHWFGSATRYEAFRLLTCLLEKSQDSLQAWKENPDSYLSEEENKKEIRSRKKAVSYLKKCLDRVKNGPEGWWTLDYIPPRKMIFRIRKKGASR